MSEGQNVKPPILRGSGNVFADLGFPDPDEHLLKADIVWGMQKVIDGKGLTCEEAALKMGLERGSLEEILQGRFREYPVERLLRLINALGNDVQIVISSQSTDRDEASLSVITV
jgi:predicted XRE-type DNA-binding protein